MKQLHKILASLILLVLAIHSFAQSPCGPNGISTDPNAPVPSSPPSGQEYKKNNFDWRIENFLINKSAYSQFQPNGSFPLPSPYYDNSVDYNHIANASLSDFQPADGWELVKRDFGFLANGSPIPVNKPIAYFMLYNKYSGILRILATLPTQNGTHQVINVNISFRNPDPSVTSAWNNLKPSALFNNYNAIAQPMDRPSMQSTVSSTAPFPASIQGFFYADFQMAYDPCTCIFESALVVTFTAIQQSNITLSGRLLATSVPISSITNGVGSFYGTNYTDDFLTSVYGSGLNTKVGMQTYKRIDDLVEDHENAAGSGYSGILEAFGTALEIGATLTGVLEEAEALTEGLELMAKFNDFFSSFLGDGESEPQPNVIMGEVAITGQMVNYAPQNDFDFMVGTPGSLNADLLPEFGNALDHKPNYPVYNEAMGTFALLNTPTYDWTRSSQLSSACPRNARCLIYEKSMYRIQTPLSFAFNPATNVNEAKSVIKGAIVLESNYPYASEIIGANSPSVIVNNIQEIYREDALKKAVYMTDFVPIQALNTLVPSIEFQTSYSVQGTGNPGLYVTAYLKLIVELEFNNTGSNGFPSRAVQILKYPLKAAYYGDPRLGTYHPVDLNQDYNYTHTMGVTNFTSNQTLYFKDLNITGNLTAAAGVNVNIIAIGNINVSPTVSIGPGITLTADAQAGGITPPQSAAAITSFCNSANYKANTYSTALRIAADNGLSNQADINNPSGSIEYSVFPNPTSGRVSLNFTSDEFKHVEVSVIDALGSKVFYEDLGNINGYGSEIDLSKLTSGIYMMQVKADDDVTFKKIVLNR
jgi:hypothetical protein